MTAVSAPRDRSASIAISNAIRFLGSKKEKAVPPLNCSFELRANSFEVSSFDTAIPNSEVEPLLRR
jgi:hypothetical protein